MTETTFVYSADEFERESDAISCRALLAVPVHERTFDWLKRMLQFAIELEFATIPPYLVAMWSIVDQSEPVAGLIEMIVKQEMLHMGLAANILNAINGKPDLASRLPRYPATGLPGGVHPGLRLQLQPLSRAAVENTFMEIERPECGPITWFKGRTYPTIGAFYEAIEDQICRLADNDFAGNRQVVKALNDFPLTAIKKKDDALVAIQTIKEQGEGTQGSPKFGAGALDVAHYYVFGEIYHGRAICEVSPGKWCYSGAALPFPKDLRQFTQAPSNAVESKAFNTVYAEMLDELQSAWETGGGVSDALTLMGQLGGLATDLMDHKSLCPNFERP
jgi:hypothetical protein